MRRRIGRSLVLTVLVLCGACVSAGPSASSFSVRRVTAGDVDHVFQAASASLMEHGYRIDVAQRQAGLLTTFPVEFGANAMALRFGAAGSGRRQAEIRIQHADDEATVYCRVLVQRQTTEAHRLLSFDAGGDDRPQQTPIEREAATERAQNTVWQTVGRDRPQERAILEDVLSRVTTPASAAP